ncbi:MAG: hypothetical protein J7621_18325 [Niastella sp.]|nr:hypothetical protein [Niastella sp.]
MKRIILLLLALLPIATLLAQADSSVYNPSGGKAGVADVADSDPGLFMVMMIFLIGFLVAVIACLALAAVLGIFIFLLTAVGIVSFSIFMAWYRRSIYSGVKWFIYLSFCFAGMAGTTFVCLLAEGFGNASYSLKTMLSWGIPIGFAGGLMGGWILLTVSRLLFSHFFAKDVA